MSQAVVLLENALSIDFFPMTADHFEYDSPPCPSGTLFLLTHTQFLSQSVSHEAFQRNIP